MAEENIPSASEKPATSENPPPVSPPARTRHVGRLGANAIALYINNADDPLIVQVTGEITLGRYSANSPTQPSIDLTPYTAYEKGVSRIHAFIRRDDSGSLVLADRASANGTYLNGERLNPVNAKPLTTGDRIRLAQLEMEIYFGDTTGEGAQDRPQPETLSVPSMSPLPPADVVPTPPFGQAISRPDSQRGVPETTQPVLTTKYLGETAKPAPPTHFQGSVAIQPKHVFSEMGTLSEKFIERLAALKGSNIELTVTINARVPDGFDEATVQAFDELCKELKFASSRFDSQ